MARQALSLVKNRCPAKQVGWIEKNWADLLWIWLTSNWKSRIQVEVLFLNRLFRIHMTNITGAGANELAMSLLPTLFRLKGSSVDKVYISKDVYSYDRRMGKACVVMYRRIMPRSISRFLECTLFSSKFNGCSPIFVLGDLPLRCKAPQTVFVQTPHLLKPENIRFNLGSLKYSVSRFIFSVNKKYVRAFIVQTDVMRDGISNSYGINKNKIHVIPQPVPSWLLDSGLRRSSQRKERSKLRLFYPAAYYPHKNHSLLSQLRKQEGLPWPVENLVLTIDESLNPLKGMSSVHCTGQLPSENMIAEYSKTDALLFLSSMESFGFPLVEAMYIGLPIICPDLPYARALCGTQAIYFIPSDIKSLCDSILVLKNRLDQGWFPDWSEQLCSLPDDWESVASQMVEVVCK